LLGVFNGALAPTIHSKNPAKAENPLKETGKADRKQRLIDRISLSNKGL
jgi:hypothetical protein